jgi:hypothetical protein
VIIYLGKEVYQKEGVGCFVDMGVIDYGYGCGKIPCIYIIKIAAAYMGYSRVFVNEKQHLLPHCNTIPARIYFR